MPERILIIKPSSLGDVATALPLAVDLKRAYPAARIDWLIHPALADLVRGHPAIHDVILFDRKQLAGWWLRPAAFRGLLHLFSLLRKRQYDLVIDAQGLFRSGLFTRITGAPVRVGFAKAREGAPIFYTHRARLPALPQVAVIRMRALLTPLKIEAQQPADAQVPIAPAATTKLRNLLGPEDYIVIIPGARWDTKRWSSAGFAAIAARLLKAGQRVVLAGSPAERALCEEVRSQAGAAADAIHNLAGQTSLAEMIALLAGAILVLGNDSGPLHVAVALNRPTVSIYGPTDPNLVGPYGQLEHVIRHPVDCHPCRRRTCDHHSCMVGVTTELVWEKIKQRLAEGASVHENVPRVQR